MYSFTYKMGQDYRGRNKTRVETKDNIVTRSNIGVRYPNRLLSFHLIEKIPMKSIFHRQCRWALEYTLHVKIYN